MILKIQQYAQQCRDRNLTAVMGVGGGKILDTAKGTAHEAGLPMVIVPTVCSSDSPCSSLSVIMNETKQLNRHGLTAGEGKDSLCVSRSKAYKLVYRKNFQICFAGSIRIPKAIFLVRAEENTDQPGGLTLGA
ncbi:iron-containing alcohol dehydrogenase [Dysosmobacter sp.]|uniref:iron-containing alcohol dehydrogenase n=1 Tax=Dysosmobacter sp. TaxID=2591382 RepID=UPI003AB28DEE